MMMMMKSRHMCIRKANRIEVAQLSVANLVSFSFSFSSQHPFSSQLEGYAYEDELLSYYHIISFRLRDKANALEYHA